MGADRATGRKQQKEQILSIKETKIKASQVRDLADQIAGFIEAPRKAPRG